MATITGPSLTYIPSPTTFAQGPHRLTSIFPVKPATAAQIWGGVTYEIDACGEQGITEVDFDEFDDCIRTAEKEFAEGLLFVESFKTGALLAALKCRPGALGGGDVDDYKARAQRRLVHVESRYLEAQLWAYIVANGNGVSLAADAPEEAVRDLASHFSEVNSPVLHLSTANAVLLAHRLDDYQEVFGIEYVVSPAYENNIIAVTGNISIWGGETTVTGAPDVTNNYIMAMAEREYQIAIECDIYTAGASA